MPRRFTEEKRKELMLLDVRNLEKLSGFFEDAIADLDEAKELLRQALTWIPWDFNLQGKGQRFVKIVRAFLADEREEAKPEEKSDLSYEDIQSIKRMAESIVGIFTVPKKPGPITITIKCEGFPKDFIKSIIEESK